jgi:hypothetical protein
MQIPEQTGSAGYEPTSPTRVSATRRFFLGGSGAFSTVAVSSAPADGVTDGSRRFADNAGTGGGGGSPVAGTSIGVPSGVDIADIVCWPVSACNWSACCCVVCAGMMSSNTTIVQYPSREENIRL